MGPFHWARARAIGNVLQVGFLENFGSFFVPRNLLESSEGPPTCVLVLSKFKHRHRTMQEVVLKNDVVVLLCPLLSFSFRVVVLCPPGCSPPRFLPSVMPSPSFYVHRSSHVLWSSNLSLAVVFLSILSWHVLFFVVVLFFLAEETPRHVL